MRFLTRRWAYSGMSSFLNQPVICCMAAINSLIAAWLRFRPRTELPDYLVDRSGFGGLPDQICSNRSLPRRGRREPEFQVAGLKNLQSHDFENDYGPRTSIVIGLVFLN